MNVTLYKIIPIAALVFSVYAISTLSPSSLFAQQQTSNYSFVTSWGSSGRAFGQFSQLLEVATDSTGNVYVTDYTALANQVQKFTSNGTFLLAWGYLGTGGGGFANALDIAIDSN
jgi:DNA-binding beta-propeller fold protein YncE